VAGAFCNTKVNQNVLNSLVARMGGTLSHKDLLSPPVLPLRLRVSAFNSHFL
jgi:hypothetical protein